LWQRLKGITRRWWSIEGPWDDKFPNTTEIIEEAEEDAT
jgi:hypothetical protein